MSLLRNHEKVETRGFLLLVLILVTVSIGGIVEIAPLFTIESTIEKVEGVRPYTPARARWAATSTSARAATTATAR